MISAKQWARHVSLSYNSIYTNLSNLSNFVHTFMSCETGSSIFHFGSKVYRGFISKGVEGCHGARCRWIMMQKWNAPSVEHPNVFPSLWRSRDLHRCSGSQKSYHIIPLPTKEKCELDIIYRLKNSCCKSWLKAILSQSGIVSVLIQVVYSWKNEELESGSPKMHRLQIGEDVFNWLQLFIFRGIWVFPVNSRKGVIAATSVEQRCDP